MENVVCEMVDTLSRLQCVNRTIPSIQGQLPDYPAFHYRRWIIRDYPVLASIEEFLLEFPYLFDFIQFDLNIWNVWKSQSYKTHFASIVISKFLIL